MKKGTIIKAAGAVLIFAGIVIIATAVGMRLWADHKQKQMITDFQKTIEKQDKNGDKQNNTSNNTDSDNSTPQTKSGAVGLLTIPKINLTVAVGDGVDTDTLRYAVGHFKGTAYPGENGNCCIAGHRSYTYSEYFNRLDEINKGDEFTIQTTKGTYKYKVYDKIVVTPDHTEVLNPTSDATVTLITCTPIRVATHRLIIKARLEK